jgi:hypothetical protein
MSTNFDWKTEEDFDWKDGQEDPPSNPSPGKRKRWLSILALILIIGSLGAYLYQRVDQRIEQNTNAMRSDVISSYNLLHLAEAEQDTELFFSLLSGRNDTWTAAQQKLFQSQALRDRTPFGLQLQSVEPLSSTENASTSVTLSPDLLSAEMTTLLPYEIQIGNGLTETVSLQETNLFRLGQERWLLSPPDEPFWGAPLSTESSHIAMNYRQRDEEIAARLLIDLERKVEEMCSQLEDIECNPDMQLNITLSTDPQTLVDAALPRAGLLTNNGLRISLPSPTLLGFPLDDAAYQALFRGYAAQMVTAVLSHQSDYECCKRVIFQQALIDYQLNQLALKPWPIRDEDYGEALRNKISLDNLLLLWRSDNAQDLYTPDGRHVYLLIDYLLSALPNHSPMLLQRELARSSRISTWLNNLFEGASRLTNTALMEEVRRGLWMRGYEQTLDTTGELVSSPPTQRLYLPCSTFSAENDGGRVSILYQFDFETSKWDGLYATEGLIWAASLPGDDILFQQEYNNQTFNWSGNLLRADQPPLPPTTADSHTISFAQTDPSTTGLTGFIYNLDSDVLTPTWFDLQDCQELNNCSNKELPGIPIWSPDGERALFIGRPSSQFELIFTERQTVMFERGPNGFDYPIYVGERSQFLEGAPLMNTDELTLVGSGHAPFWIDKDTIGYVAGGDELDAAENARVMMTAVDQLDAPRVLISFQDIESVIEEEPDTFHFYRTPYVMVNPHNPDQFFVVLMSTHNQLAHVVSFNRRTHTVQYLVSAGYRANHSLGISPNGRYLVLSGVDNEDLEPDSSNALLQVYDLEREETIPFLTLISEYPPFPSYDWSLDEQWLAIMLDSNVVGLFSPDQKLLQFLKTPPGECGTPIWINN